MAIHESIEIGRSPQEVFDYACSAGHFTEWRRISSKRGSRPKDPFGSEVESGRRDE